MGVTRIQVALCFKNNCFLKLRPRSRRPTCWLKKKQFGVLEQVAEWRKFPTSTRSVKLSKDVNLSAFLGLFQPVPLVARWRSRLKTPHLPFENIPVCSLSTARSCWSIVKMSSWPQTSKCEQHAMKRIVYQFWWNQKIHYLWAEDLVGEHRAKYFNTAKQLRMCNQKFREGRIRFTWKVHPEIPPESGILQIFPK